MLAFRLLCHATLQRGAPRSSAILLFHLYQDELDAQPAKMCDLRDTLLEPWLWDARGGLCFEEEVNGRFVLASAGFSYKGESSARDAQELV